MLELIAIIAIGGALIPFMPLVVRTMAQTFGAGCGCLIFVAFIAIVTHLVLTAMGMGT